LANQGFQSLFFWMIPTGRSQFSILIAK